MAEWFKCAPLPLLDGMQDLSDDAQLVYVKALLVIYHRDGRIQADALRNRFPKWRPHRLRRAISELLEADKLVGTADGQLHNERAMYELAQLQQWSDSLSAAGQKGARAKAKRDRTARRIAERNRSPDMFPNDIENEFTGQKPNENNGNGLAGSQHARAPARGQAETPLNGRSTAVEPALSTVSNRIENGQRDQKPNENNDNPTARPWHARASEQEQELRSTPLCPLTDEIEQVEGTVEDDDDFAVPRRKPGRPIPQGWRPDQDNLSEAVLEMTAQWPDGEYERECTKFVEDAHSNDRRHRDWDRALGVWLTKHDGYLQNRRQKHERPSGWRTRA